MKQIEYNKEATEKLYKACCSKKISEFVTKNEGKLMLLESGVNNQPVFITEKDTFLSIAEKLIENCADISMTFGYYKKNSFIQAIATGQIGVAKLLIDNGRILMY